jgi:hypothetical protein
MHEKIISYLFLRVGRLLGKRGLTHEIPDTPEMAEEQGKKKSAAFTGARLFGL